KDSGNVVADAPIQVKAAPIYGSGRPSVFTSVGNTVPDGTTFVEFGARVNPECTWLQAADLSLVSFAIVTGQGGALSDDFKYQLDGGGVPGNASGAGDERKPACGGRSHRVDYAERS